MNNRLFRAVSLVLLSAPALPSLAQSPLPKPPLVPDTALRLEAVATYPEVEAVTTVVGGPDGAVYVGNDPRDSRLNTAGPECTIVRLTGSGAERKRTVFADKVFSPAGMAWHDGWLYVIHDPLLTRFKDTDGDGVADVREDLVTKLGLPPYEGLNDHVVSGFTLGMDGFFYISVGDRGIYQATGKDGSSISLQGGGIVRCRPDGTQLEVFSSGTRNHLEVDLDAEDNAFTLDNTDDGNGWWTRLTHHIESGFYGYPFLYKRDQANGLLQAGPQKSQFFPGAPARNERFLPAMTDFGGGSPTGGLAYLSDGLPEQYRNRLLFSEWGQRRVSAIEVARDGASFKFIKNEALVQEDKGSDFRPMQLSVAADGSLLIADWQWGGWKGPKTVGSVWRLSWPEAKIVPRLKDESKAAMDELIAALAHPDRDQRLRAQYALIGRGDGAVLGKVAALVSKADAPMLQRIHALWTLSGMRERSRPEKAQLVAALTNDGTSLPPAAVAKWMQVPRPMAEALTAALTAPEASLRIQGLRVLSLWVTPAIKPELILACAKDKDPAVRLAYVTSVGRIVQEAGDLMGGVQKVPERGKAAAGLIALLVDEDAWVRFGAREALKKVGDWYALGGALQAVSDKELDQAWLTVEGVHSTTLVTLVTALAKAPDPTVRLRAVEALGTIAYRSAPYAGTWWGTQPVKNPAPPNSVTWAATNASVNSLIGALRDVEKPVRLAAAKALSLGVGPEALPALRDRLTAELDMEVRRQLIETLGIQRDPGAMDVFTSIALDEKADAEFRDTAIGAVVSIGGEEAKRTIAKLADAKLSEGTARKIIQAAGELKVVEAAPALMSHLKDASASNREAAVKALGQLGLKANATGALIEALTDTEPKVQQAALEALGNLRDRAALPAILAQAPKSKFRKETLNALANMPDPASVPYLVASLNEKSAGTRRNILKALKSMSGQAIPLVMENLASGKIPAEFATEIESFFHGGAITKWRIIGPFENVWEAVHPPETAALAGGDFLTKKHLNAEGRESGWNEVSGEAQDGHIDLGKVFKTNGMVCAYAFTEIEAPEATETKLLCGADDQIALWVNGQKVLNVPGSNGYEADRQETPIKLKAGKNQILLKIGNNGGAWEFAARIPGLDGSKLLKSKEATPEEKQRAFALAATPEGAWVNAGDAARGAKVFGEQTGALGGICATCHAVAGKGGQIGPDLSAVAVNYKRADLIASILEPSKTIALGFEQVVAETKAGETFVGALRGETAETMTLMGADAVQHVLKKTDLKSQAHLPTSLMPPGLTQGLKPAEFTDLLAYLESLKSK